MGFGIFSIASSSLGGRKKGYPKLQELWELTLALGRFPFDFVFLILLVLFLMDFVKIVVILRFGSSFWILELVELGTPVYKGIEITGCQQSNILGSQVSWGLALLVY